MQMNSGLVVNFFSYNNNNKIPWPYFNKNENSIQSIKGCISPINMWFLCRPSHLEA